MSLLLSCNRLPRILFPTMVLVAGCINGVTLPACAASYQSLHDFAAYKDGVIFEPDLLFKSSSGVLYGVTQTGGFYNRGTIYSVNPQGGIPFFTPSTARWSAQGGDWPKATMEVCTAMLLPTIFSVG